MYNKRIIFLISLLPTAITSFSQLGKNGNIHVADTAMYDSDFVEYWSHVHPLKVKISNDSIIVDNDTINAITIPTDLSLNHDLFYECRKSDTLYSLIIKRLNYTNIKFAIMGKANSETIFKRRGIAVLESSFYLGSEGVWEKNEKEIYGMVDYNVMENGNVKHNLLIAVGTDERINFYEYHSPKKIALAFNKIK